MRRMLGLFCVLIGIFILIAPSLNFHRPDFRFDREQRVNLEAPVPPVAPVAPEREFRPHRVEFGRDMHHDHGAPWFFFRLIASFVTVFTVGGMIALGYLIYLKWKAAQNPIHYV